MILPALKKTYQGQLVLDIPSMEIADGSITAICGQNGSGKSTLAKILAGIEKPDDGTVTSDAARSVGYLPQQSYAFHMSITSNLMLNKDPEKTKQENLAHAQQLLKEIGLESMAKKNAKKLSGGETQKMALARLLMKSYDMIILDEPTASMDTASIPTAEKMICDYQRRTGCTILIITHSPEQAQRLASHTIRLEGGKLCE
ncbi:MAG: ATP-binding cassette domain-containing protein [Lachnospiraceae bacterium]|nr:ATP-binding cassette domain-containing protein [Lachnospiraceae bacterium]MBR3263416.1 ATP-binding cassette domain-containing protein [Lachnospiraceae bacterium]MDO4207034.1 ATP-binding cassette domain-containing protein [Lachnospiraceae bacterium]